MQESFDLIQELDLADVKCCLSTIHRLPWNGMKTSQTKELDFPDSFHKKKEDSSVIVCELELP